MIHMILIKYLEIIDEFEAIAAEVGYGPLS